MTRDERIAKYLVGLYPLFAVRYQGLFRNLGPDWMPYSGLRDMVEQARLYAQGRDAPGEIVTNAKAGDSPHGYGCAIDTTIFIQGIPIYNHNRWNELAEAAKLCGLTWGGNFGSFKDMPHVELPIKCSWRIIGDAYRTGGITQALSAINKNIVR